MLKRTESTHLGSMRAAVFLTAPLYGTGLFTACVGWVSWVASCLA